MNTTVPGQIKIGFYSADSLPAGTPQLLDLSFFILAGAPNGAVSPVNIVTSPATASRLNEGQLTLTPVNGSVTVDNTRPTVIASQFHFENAPQRITVQFSENVKDSLSLNDITLVNLLNNQTISASNMTLTYDDGTNTATITFHDLPANYLGDGRYRLTISSAGVTDAAGNTLDGDGSGGDHVLNFFQKVADANRDETVNFLDLVALAQNYGATGTGTWATADFNYDGNVDFLDLVLMAQNYDTTLPPAPAAPVAASQPVQAPVTATPVTAAALAALIAPKPAAVTSPVTTKVKTVTKPAAKVIKPVAKPRLANGVTPIQSGPNAPFAAKTKLRAQNKPATLVGDVLEKNKGKKLFN